MTSRSMIDVREFIRSVVLSVKNPTRDIFPSFRDSLHFSRFFFSNKIFFFKKNIPSRLIYSWVVNKTSARTTRRPTGLHDRVTGPPIKLTCKTKLGARNSNSRPLYFRMIIPDIKYISRVSGGRRNGPWMFYRPLHSFA